jgi:hypothetical protein
MPLDALGWLMLLAGDVGGCASEAGTNGKARQPTARDRRPTDITRRPGTALCWTAAARALCLFLTAALSSTMQGTSSAVVRSLRALLAAAMPVTHAASRAGLAGEIPALGSSRLAGCAWIVDSRRS